MTATRCLLALLLLPALASAQAPRLLIPAYFPVPDGKKSWDDLIATHTPGKVEVIAIVNIGAGAGHGKGGEVCNGGPFIPRGWDAKVTSAFYKDVLGRAVKKGVRVIGYVSTRRGTRPLDLVKQDIAQWKKWPGVTGVFLDEQAVGTPEKPAAARDMLDAYKAMRSQAEKIFTRPLVISNPGNVGSRPDDLEAYLAVADVLVMLEGTNAGVYSPPAWTKKYEAWRFAVLIHQVPMPGPVGEFMEKQRVGWVYFTDAGKDGNPWSRLPSFMGKLLEAVRTARPAAIGPVGPPARG